MAHVMSEVLGTPVRFQQLPAEAYKDDMIGLGMSDAMAQGMLDMTLAKGDGLDNAEPHPAVDHPHQNPPVARGCARNDHPLSSSETHRAAVEWRMRNKCRPLAPLNTV
jgi:hypothetical protein